MGLGSSRVRRLVAAVTLALAIHLIAAVATVSAVTGGGDFPMRIPI
jgi:hypothetical protein